MKTQQQEWPIAFFDDDYLRIYDAMFTEEKTAAEIDFIASALDLAPGAAVLDLACGLGRHALGMASRGYRVTGVDFNERYLEIAARRAKEQGVDVRWMKADMRELPFTGEFAGAYSYFTSFGYFSDDENEQVIALVARALAPRGRFLIDMANRDWIVTHPQQRTWNQRSDGALLMEEVTLDLVVSRVVSRQILIEGDGGSRVTKEYNLRTYTCAELTRLFMQRGLAVRSVWGGIDRQPLTTESRRLVMLAEKT